MTHRVPSLVPSSTRTKAILVESGDHDNGPAVARAVAVSLLAPVPSGLMEKTALPRTNAILIPSGDQAGAVPDARRRRPPPVASTRYTPRLRTRPYSHCLRSNTRRASSGDQLGRRAGSGDDPGGETPVASCRSPVPSARIV